MDMDIIEDLNEIRPSVYRVAMKLRSLQRLCHFDIVSVQHVMGAFGSLDVTLQHEIRLNKQELAEVLYRMFESVSHEVPGHVAEVALDETCDFILRLFDRGEAASVSLTTLQTALIALSTDALLAKYTALVQLCQNIPGCISRSGLRSLLEDLHQVPAAVQEEVVFGSVEMAVKSCFNGMFTPTASTRHVMSWLQKEPHLLQWLPTLYRLSVTQNVSHMVRCHTCKTFPITGLRYRCLKCVNVHVCQSCFLSHRYTRKHKQQHPVLEFCTKPTWKESLSLLVHSARHTLLPRRCNKREADGRVLIWAEPGETQNKTTALSDNVTSLDDSAVCHSPRSSEGQQSDETTDISNLQRDKWLLEQEIMVWRVTVQSKHGLLEDRCSEMEVNMESLRHQNISLQALLTRTLNKMAAPEHINKSLYANKISHVSNLLHVNNSPHPGIMPQNTVSDTPHVRDTAPISDMPNVGDTSYITDMPRSFCVTWDKGGNAAKDDTMREEWSEEESRTPEEEEKKRREEPSSTIPWFTSMSRDSEEEVQSVGEWHLFHPVGDDAYSSKKDHGKCPEELLQQTVDRLRSELETDSWRDQETEKRKGAELVKAADQVGESVHHLVVIVRNKVGESCSSKNFYSPSKY